MVTSTDFLEVSQEVVAKSNILDLTTSWVWITSIIIFVIAYYFIATEDKYEINKAKPALFSWISIFMLIGFYYAVNGLDSTILHNEVNHLIVEIAWIFFFLLVAMTYIEAMIDRKVFSFLRYNLVSKWYNYKKLFWITWLLAFFISPIADNLTTALILSTVLITIDKDNKLFIIPAAVNIVVAANAWWVWSPFWDITTLMVWMDWKWSFIDFLYLFPASIIGWSITAYLLSRFIPNGNPPFIKWERQVEILEWWKQIIALFILTIISAIICHQFLNLPAMWGMMFGLSLLKLYTYFLKKKWVTWEHWKAIDAFEFIKKIENDTLLFFFGILAAVWGLHFLGFLEYFTVLYSHFWATTVNIWVWFLSAIVDNIPVMSAVLKSSPDMWIWAHSQWMLVTLTAWIWGSLISFGSAAWVWVMWKLHWIYTFKSHMKLAWTILIWYIISVVIWYIQFQIFGFGA